MNEQKPSTIQNEKFENLSLGGKSINLAPKLTRAEAKVEGKKIQINTSAAIALLVLVLFSIVVVGVNIFSKLGLNIEKSKQFALEEKIKQRNSLLLSNEEIIRRVNLYKKIETTTFSSKDVVIYWQDISSGLATIDSIELSEGLNFKSTGTAKTLTDVSKLWYLLGNDRRVETVNLKSVAKDSSLARFTFEGKLNLNEFTKATQ